MTKLPDQQFWYYENWTNGTWLIKSGTSDDLVRKVATEQDAFNLVKSHNESLLTIFDRAKAQGRAPGAI